jgi:hypothetical protein
MVTDVRHPGDPINLDFQGPPSADFYFADGVRPSDAPKAR